MNFSGTLKTKATLRSYLFLIQRYSVFRQTLDLDKLVVDNSKNPRLASAIPGDASSQEIISSVNGKLPPCSQTLLRDERHRTQLEKDHQVRSNGSKRWASAKRQGLYSSRNSAGAGPITERDIIVILPLLLRRQNGRNQKPLHPSSDQDRGIQLIPPANLPCTQRAKHHILLHYIVV